MHQRGYRKLRTIINRQWRLWSSLRETAYLLYSPRNAKMLLEAIAEIERAKTGDVELVEAEFQHDIIKLRKRA